MGAVPSKEWSGRGHEQDSIGILNRSANNKPKRWTDFSSFVLCAYRTLKRISTQATPFSVACDRDDGPHREMIPLARFVLVNKVLDQFEHNHKIEVLKEKGQNIEDNWLTYQRQISQAYNKRVRPRTFGDICFKSNRAHIEWT